MTGELRPACITPDVAAAYAAGELTDEQLEALDDHISDCSICRQLLSNAAQMALPESFESDAAQTEARLHSPSASPRPMRESGAVAGRYVIDGPIGAGGMGVVYAAHDPDLKRRVALKVLRAGLFAGDGAAKELLRREAMAMARLTHPNVVGVYDLFEDGGTMFVAMEFVEGTTLRGWFAAERRSWREAIAMLLLAGKGLAAAHAEGIVHRDFKPENVLVGRSGRVCVSDFGLSRVAAEARPEGGPVSERGLGGLLSMPRAGTPRYMAPEQRRGDPATPRSDQFSFCVVLHEGLYGGLPFATSSQRGRGEPAPRVRLAPAQLAPVPSWVRSCLQRGLSERADDRFDSMDELLRALARDPAARRRRLAAGALAIAALGAGVAAWQHARVVRREICAHPEAAVVGVWDGHRRGHAEEAFAFAGPYSKDAWTRVGPLLDAYMSRWVAARRASCEAALGRGEPSRVASDPAMLCLDDRLGEARALVDALVSVTSGQAAAAALVAVQSLRPVSQCDRAAPGGMVAEPRRPATSPADRAAAEAIRADLAHGQVSDYLGKYAEAAASALRAKQGAEAIGDAALLAQSLLQAAQAHASSGPEVADEEAHAAIAAADAIGDDSHRGYALARLIFIDGYYRSDWALGRRWHDEALAVVRRLGGEDRLEGEIHNHFGIVLTQQTRFEEARAELSRAVELYAGIGDAVHLGSALDNLGLAEVGLGDFDAAIRAYDRSLSTIETALGASHPRNARVLNNVATMHLSRREFERSRETARRAVEINDGVGLTDGLTAEEPIETMGEALLEAGRYAEALPVLQRSHAIEEKASASMRWQVETLADLGRAYLGLHQVDEARAVLERVVAAKTGDPIYAADARFALARTLTELHLEPARAQSLAAEALGGIDSIVKPSPLEASKRAEVKAWLTAL